LDSVGRLSNLTGEPENPVMQRIQKFLAHQGLASRRQIDQMLEEGRININGKVAKPGDQIDGSERIALDGKIIRLNKSSGKPRVLMYHKPIGQVCTRSDPEGRETVFQHLPNLTQGRWVGIGRLDINTSGLILFTDQGELANRLMHPSFEIEREYAVRVHGTVEIGMLDQLRNGIELEDGPAHFDQIMDSGGEGRNHWYHVIIREGRNREVRRLWEAVGVEVSRLIRVRYDQVTLPKWLKPGKYRYLDDEPVQNLYKRLEIALPDKPHNARRGSSSSRGKSPRG
jgi:23S rRNA pseudouridine2605 synthase